MCFMMCTQTATQVTLNGPWTHNEGSIYYGGRLATLTDVVNHYDRCMSLGLNSSETADLVGETIAKR